MRLTSVISILLSVMLSGCVYTPKVEKVIGTWSGEGVLYALPRTKLTATFEVSRVDFTAPVCVPTNADLKELGLEPGKVPKGPRSIYAVHSGALNARPIPDANKVFAMQFPEASNWANNSMLVGLNAMGVIESVDASATSKAAEIANKVIEIGLNVGVGLMGAGAAEKENFDPKDCSVIAQNYSSLQKEWEGYRVTGIPPLPVEAVTLYRAEIEKAQAAALAHFIGKAKVYKTNIVCDMSPESPGDFPLFHVSPSDGFKIESACRLLGTSMLPKAALCQGPNECKQSTVTLHLAAEKAGNIHQADLSAIYKNAGESANDIGFYFNVPVDGLISISGHEKALVAEKRYTLPQFGTVGTLPRLKGNSPALIVSLYPDSGALKSVKFSNDAADMAALLGTVSTGTSNYLSARTTQEQKEAEDAAKKALEEDELTVLTRNKNLAETRLAIQLAIEALEQAGKD